MSSDDLGLMPREYPRSEAQKRIDKAEDTPETDTLDLSGLKMARISFRALAIETLTHLDVSDNSITRLVPDIGGLASLEKLDVSGNQLRSLPKELEELEELTWFACARNRIGWFPGNVYQIRTTPVLGPVTKSIPRITGAGRRPGTPPTNAGSGPWAPACFPH